MTMIQCFNGSLVENIAGCLHLKPEKLILLGDEEKTRSQIQRYREVLRQRGQNTRIILRGIRRNDMTAIAAVLADIVHTETDCVIDLSGGDELVSMAVGAMLAGLDGQARQRVSVQKFDPVSGAVLDCDGDGKVLSGGAAAMTVRELITLHGGVIHPSTYQPPASCTPEDLDPLWKIVAEAPKSWNRAITVLREFESRSDSKTQIVLPMAQLRGRISNYGEKEAVLRKLLDEFRRRGVIEDRSSGNCLNYAYTSPLLRYCTQKAGNVLEIKTLLEARGLREKGAAFFRDCQIGVNIDWDGIVYDPAERIPETRNEIDLILTRGLTPLFISCKNGDIGDEELYKLHTVATRFGGPYACKMLIATDLDRKSPAANRAFIQRARDMNIYLVTDAAELSAEDWHHTFRTAVISHQFHR